MRKIAVALLCFILAMVALSPRAALAFDAFDKVCSSGGGGSAVCTDKGSTADPVSGSNGIIKKAANIIAVIAGVAAVVVIVFGGITYITSGGDATKTQKARSMILGSVIGSAVVIAAWAIVSFVVDKFIG